MSNPDAQAEQIGRLITEYLEWKAERRNPALEPWLRAANGVVLVGVRDDLRRLDVDITLFLRWSEEREREVARV